MTGRTDEAAEAAYDVLGETVRKYRSDYAGTPEAGEKGWNNTTRFVECGGERFVLRVYETHRDPDKIRFEHEVLLRLTAAGLTFRTPVPQTTGDGETLVRLEDGSGRYACLFAYIEGTRPADKDLRPLRAFGAAAGELSAALADIRTDRKPAYRPYYELEQAYPLCEPDGVSAFCTAPPAALSAVQSQLSLLSAAYNEISRETKCLRHLPHQLVHGDLNASNLLVGTSEPDSIEALLDFEFCTYDVRAMEAAVILSGLPQTDEQVTDCGATLPSSVEVLRSGTDRADPVFAFGESFRRHVRLEPAEIEAIPLLMRLRKVDVFLHFLTRYWEGTDGPEVLEEQARSLSEDLERMRLEESALIRSLNSIFV